MSDLSDFARKKKNRARRLYLGLIKKVILDHVYRDPVERKRAPTAPGERVIGRNWPRDAHSMIGVKRLDNVQDCCEAVLAEGIDGDFAECGVWRGGAAIFMRALLEAYGDHDRKVWLFDSFAGLPPPDPVNFPEDAGLDLSGFAELAVPLSAVRDNFRRYGLLDERVVFVEGLFKDTMPRTTIGPIAVLRLDGDLYESTWQCLTALYPRVSPGGFVIIDDYGAIKACRAAVEDYRRQFGITGEVVRIDRTGVYWRKGGQGATDSTPAAA